MSATPLSAGEFIRQTQVETGLTWDFHVSAAKGTAWSPIAVADGGSSLKLFARGTGPDTRLYQLDETTLGSGFPSAQITIRSEDPHFPHRTRADRPFTVSLAVKDSHGSGKKVSLHRKGTLFHPARHAPEPNSPDQSFGWWTFERQGEHNSVFYPAIPSADPTQAEGLETFTAYTAPGEESPGCLPLKSARIQIWPVATATIRGLQSGATLSAASLKKPVSILCQDLYPDSVTYVQIYHGDAKLGTRGTVLPQSVVRFDTTVPQDQQIPLGEWRDTLPDGKYTIEVLTITPFNQGQPERLAHSTFVLDRGMHAPSMVNRTR